MRPASKLRRRRYSPLERRRRAAARLALYGSLALLAGGSLLGVRWLQRPLRIAQAEDWTRVRYRELPEVDLLSRYLQVDTSYPDGSELEGAEFLARELAAEGVKATIERLDATQANLWAFVEGEDPRALVLHHHLDVEAVTDAESWTHPPFSGAIDGPWIYGRGAFDMKSIGAAQLAAFLDLHRDGRRPRRSVLLLATSGEERGSLLGTKWVLERHPELVARMWAVLTEGGVVEAKGPGLLKYWGIEHGQKAYATLTVCADDRAALESLRAFLLAHLRGSRPPRLLPEVEEFFRRYAPSRDRAGLRQALADPAALARDVVAVTSLPRYLRALLQDDVQPGRVTAASGGGHELRLVFHLLPGGDPESARRELVPDRLLAGFAWTLEEATAAPPSSVAHPLYRELERLVAERYPDVPVGPFLLPFTATDSRYFRAAGVPSYGFSPFPFVAADTYSGGRGNERIGLLAYVEGVRLYQELVRRVAE